MACSSAGRHSACAACCRRRIAGYADTGASGLPAEDRRRRRVERASLKPGMVYRCGPGWPATNWNFRRSKLQFRRVAAGMRHCTYRGSFPLVIGWLPGSSPRPAPFWRWAPCGSPEECTGRGHVVSDRVRLLGYWRHIDAAAGARWPSRSLARGPRGRVLLRRCGVVEAYQGVRARRCGRANLVVRVPKLAEVELLWRRVLPVAVVAVDLATPVRSTMQQDRFRHHGARVHDPPASASALFSSRHTTQQPKGEAES
jgi:hypothetical protein